MTNTLVFTRAISRDSWSVRDSRKAWAEGEIYLVASQGCFAVVMRGMDAATCW